MYTVPSRIGCDIGLLGAHFVKFGVKRIVLGVAMVLTLSNCAYMARIEKPDQTTLTDQLPEFVVELHSRVDPNRVSATLDGQPYSFSTQPPYTPGSVITGPAPSFTPGQHVFRVSADNLTSQPFDVLGDSVTFTPALLQLGTPLPNPPSNCGTASSTCAVSTLGGLNIAQGIPITIAVLTPSAPFSALTVTVAPSNRLVSVGGQPAGASATTTIGTNTRHTNFTITGIQAGVFDLYVSAPGYQAASIQGRVL